MSFKSILSHSKSICKSHTRLIGVGLGYKNNITVDRIRMTKLNEKIVALHGIRCLNRSLQLPHTEKQGQVEQ